MLSLSICDDEEIEILYLTALLEKWADLRGHNLKLSTFKSAEEFLFKYEDDKSVEILLLDVQMKEIDGISLAKRLRQEKSTVQIIFITGYPDFMSDGYDVSALHYLMKPVKEAKLFEVLDKAEKNVKQSEACLFLPIDGQMNRIPFSEIRFIEAQGHYIVINCVSTEYRTKMTLSEIQKTLDNGFFRCQRSFIVGLRFVRKITRTVIILDGGTEIALSRDLYDSANRAVIEFFP